MGFSNSGDNMGHSKRSDWSKEFIDRADILLRVDDDICCYNEGAIYKLYSIYGFGGVGKTALVNKLRKTYKDVNMIIFITFCESKGALRRLLDLRLKFTHAPKFDFLFLNYWSIAKNEELSCDYVKALSRSFKNISSKYSLIEGFLDMAIPQFCRAVEVLVAARKLFDYLNQRSWKKDDFSELLDKAEDAPGEILRVLPRILAEEISEHTLHSTGEKPIFIFDDYAVETLISDCEWLRIFIDCFESGFFIVTSCERLRWFDAPSEKVVEVSLSSIPEADAKDYMKRLNIAPDAVEKIVEQTNCIPIYLDMGISVYLASDGKDFNLAISSRKQLVDKFLCHLTEDERRIVSMLSVIKVFNEKIYVEMLCANVLSIEKYSYHEFASKSIIADTDYDPFRVHSVIAQSVQAVLDNGTKRLYISQYLKYLGRRLLFELTPQDVLPYVICAFQLYAGLPGDGADISKEETDILFDIALYLMDTCWVIELNASVKTLTVGGVIEALFRFINGCAVRQENIAAGLGILERISLCSLGDSKHKKTIVCERNYLRSIRGHYADAERAFTDFYNDCEPYEKNERYYVKGSIYYADMMMLRGKFKKALQVFNELNDSAFLQINAHIAKPLCFEIAKQSGHCHRFNMLLDMAEKYYHKGQEDNEHDRTKAYRLTTLCETLCYFRPDEVIPLSHEAYSINGRIHNANSLAKVDNAMAIVYAHKQDFAAAYACVERALSTNETTNYVAGNLFSLLAKSYVDLAKNGTVSETIRNQFECVWESVDRVYGYLKLPIYIMTGETQRVEALRGKFEWIDFDETKKQYERFLSAISRR